MDARQRRTNQKLSEVILRLSAQRPASEITVSEVTIAAGINRSTFYQHASSTTDLLENVLRTELDDIRSRYLGTALSSVDGAALRDIVVAVLDHVSSHAEIYSRGLGVSSAASSLHPLLSRHFEESVTDLIAAETVVVPRPSGTSAVNTRFHNESAARFIADGTVGAMEVWLRTPEPRSTTDFLRAYRVFMPGWWPIGRDDDTAPVISVTEPATA